MVMPGDNVQLVVELITPVALEKGLRFAIREGGTHGGRGHDFGNYEVIVVSGQWSVVSQGINGESE